MRQLRKILLARISTAKMDPPPIEKKDRALPLYVDILQRPTRLRDSAADIADWFLYLAGSDVTAESADGAAYTRLKLPLRAIGNLRASKHARVHKCDGLATGSRRVDDTRSFHVARKYVKRLRIVCASAGAEGRGWLN